MGFFIDMIDVGQGDAFLLTLGSQTRDVTFLIDGGPPSKGKTVAAFVKQHAGGYLDVVIGTHLDIDHIGGLKDVVENCTIGRFYLNLPPDPRKSLSTLLRQRLERKKSGSSWDMLQKSLEAASDLADALMKKKITPEAILAGYSWNLGEITLHVLNPTPDRLLAAWKELEENEDPVTASIRELTQALGLKVAPETTTENNSSVVIELAYKGQPYALLAADAGADVLKAVATGKRYPFLKVPHHGSKTGLDEQLLTQLRPETGYIPVGDNDYGHPAIEILDLLRKYGAKTYCSQKTRDCRRDCPQGGFGNLCHRKDREFRPGWSSVDSNKCANNQ